MFSKALRISFFKAHKGRHIQLALLVSLSLLFLGCEASKVQRVVQTDMSSRDGSRGSNFPTLPDGPSGGDLCQSEICSDCGRVAHSGQSFEAVLSSYVDPQTRAYILDLVRLRITQPVANWSTSDSEYMQIFRFEEDESGRRFNNQAVEISFQKKYGDRRYLPTTLTQISKAGLMELISRHSLGDDGVSLTNFFEHFIMTLRDIDLIYEGFTFAFYDAESADPSEAVARADTLIPSFIANPNKYAAFRQNTSLPRLHPLYHLRNSTMNDDQYFYKANEFCLMF